MRLATARPARRVLVTGGSGAFGTGLRQALEQRGAAVVGLDRVPSPQVVACDLAAAERIPEAVAEAIGRLGGLDAVVHCAGIGPAVDIGAAPGAEVEETLAVNLLAAWRVTAAALPALSTGPGRGRVVLVSSLLSRVTVPFAGAYCVSKRALLGYGDALRVEYGRELAVTCVLPGYVDTPIHSRARDAGVALDGLVPAERLTDVVGTLTRVLTAERPPRETATTRSGQAVRALARVAPGLVDAVVQGRAHRHLRAGGFPGAALAEAYRHRATGPVHGTADRQQDGAAR